MHESPKKSNVIQLQGSNRQGDQESAMRWVLEESFMLRNVCFFSVKLKAIRWWHDQSDLTASEEIYVEIKISKMTISIQLPFFFLISLGDWKGQINTIRRLNEIGLARLQNFWPFLIIILNLAGNLNSLCLCHSLYSLIPTLVPDSVPLFNLLKDLWPQHVCLWWAHLMLVTSQEVGGETVGYSWERVTCLIETYCGRWAFL